MQQLVASGILVVGALICVVVMILLLFLGRATEKKYGVGIFFSLEFLALFIVLQLLGFAGLAMQLRGLLPHHQLPPRGSLPSFLEALVGAAQSISPSTVVAILCTALGISLLVIVTNLVRTKSLIGIVITLGQAIAAIVLSYIGSVALFYFGRMFCRQYRAEML